jgi:hypothetical protein
VHGDNDAHVRGEPQGHRMCGGCVTRCEQSYMAGASPDVSSHTWRVGGRPAERSNTTEFSEGGGY